MWKYCVVIYVCNIIIINTMCVMKWLLLLLANNVCIINIIIIIIINISMY